MNIFKSQLGVSIIEIIIVTAIIGMISLLLFNLPNSLKLINKSNHETIANQIAIKKMEDLRSLGYINLANGSTAISDSRLSQLPSPISEVLIEDCPVSICTQNELIKKITITISWQESQSRKNVTISTLVSDGGLK